MGHYTQETHDSFLLMNDHLTKDAPQETLFRPDEPRIATETGTKPYILELLDNIKPLQITVHCHISYTLCPVLR